MKPTRAIIFYALGVIVLSALVAPWCFWAAHQVGDWPFRRVFDRVILIVAALGLWPVLRGAGVRSWQDIGYTRTGCWWRLAVMGWLLGVVSYGIGGILLAPALRWEGCVTRLAGFVAVGLAVALVEETFFRGGLQNVLQRQMPVWVALVLVSGIYSAVHFLKPSAANIADDAVTWRSGFEYLGRICTNSFREPGVWRGVVTLWLAGGVLGWAFVRLGSLYVSIGLHAGWVFALKTVACLGGGSLVNDARLWPVLVAVGGGIEWLARRKKICSG